MSDEPETQRLQDLIPQSLDDIIRVNRDKCRLAFATDEECHELERDITNAAGGKVCHTLTDWNLLMIHVTANGSLKSLPKLLGSVQETGQCWITSTVKGIDTHSGLVLTENSLYRVVGQRDFEPDQHLLLHVCVWLNQRGAGHYFGVPEFFY